LFILKMGFEWTSTFCESEIHLTTFQFVYS
jgi:hypothetical protein